MLLVFLNLLFLGTCYIFFAKSWDFLWTFISVPYFGLACDYENSSLCLKIVRRRRLLDRGQKDFECEDNSNNIARVRDRRPMRNPCTPLVYIQSGTVKYNRRTPQMEMMQ